MHGNLGGIFEIYLLLDQRFNTSFFLTARTSSVLKGTSLSFNKIGALKFLSYDFPEHYSK